TSVSANAPKTNESAPVAETVNQLITTSQEKPAVAAAPVVEAKPLPAYDAEAIKKMNVSQAIRHLFGLGYTRSQIVKEFPKAMGRTVIYQHVRNVLVTPVKKSS